VSEGTRTNEIIKCQPHVVNKIVISIHGVVEINCRFWTTSDGGGHVTQTGSGSGPKPAVYLYLEYPCNVSAVNGTAGVHGYNSVYTSDAEPRMAARNQRDSSARLQPAHFTAVGSWNVCCRCS